MSVLRWTKLGRIFDPGDHALGLDSVGWAQSPQTLVLEDRVRIFFSTRVSDATPGMYLSHVTYVDMTRDLSEILGVSEGPVLPLGDLGCFDEHGIFPLNPVRVGTAVYGYTCGWSRRQSVSVETAIGLAVSHDEGRSFARLGPGPVLAASLEEPSLVGDGFVKIIDGTYHMWYIFGRGWRRQTPDSAPDRTYKIGHAISADGIAWTKEDGRAIVSDVLGELESQALPTVITLGGRHHMFFCYRQSFDFRANPDRAYRLGYAWSEDLDTWHRDDSGAPRPTPGDWDSDMMCYPHVFAVDERVYLLYNGNEFGRHGFGAARLER